MRSRSLRIALEAAAEAQLVSTFMPASISDVERHARYMQLPESTRAFHKVQTKAAILAFLKVAGFHAVAKDVEHTSFGEPYKGPQDAQDASDTHTQIKPLPIPPANAE